MSAARLNAAELAVHLANEPPEARRLVLALRRMVLRLVPESEEAIKFHSLCYFHSGARFGSIGGNICMIEVRRGTVALSFIHGAGLDDPHGLLRGRGKAKRGLPVTSQAFASDPRVTELIRGAAGR